MTLFIVNIFTFSSFDALLLHMGFDILHVEYWIAMLLMVAAQASPILINNDLH